MAHLRSIKELGRLDGKVVLLRADFNVSFSHGKILDAERIERTIPTIEYLTSRGAKVVIFSHLGRPDGKKNGKFSLLPVAQYLRTKLKGVHWASDCIGPKVRKSIVFMNPGEVLVCENVRFYSGEELGDTKFTKDLSSLGDLFVNDGFAVSHRKHASVYGLAKLLPSYAGINLEQEVIHLDKVLKGFHRPAIAIFGGAKISSKIKVIENIAKRFDYVMIGGALANNFFKLLGYNIGSSIYEADYMGEAEKISAKYGKKIIIPSDVVITNNWENPRWQKTVEVKDLSKIKKTFYIVNIGPKTVKHFAKHINQARTMIWNGPLGMFEQKQFAKGTIDVAKVFAKHSEGAPYGLIGGGETIAAVKLSHQEKKIDYISTGGGAMLEYLESGSLPGIKVLEKTKKR